VADSMEGEKTLRVYFTSERAFPQRHRHLHRRRPRLTHPPPQPLRTRLCRPALKRPLAPLLRRPPTAASAEAKALAPYVGRTTCNVGFTRSGCFINLWVVKQNMHQELILGSVKVHRTGR